MCLYMYIHTHIYDSCEARQLPQSVVAIIITFGILPTLDVRVLLLETPHTLVTGCGETKLELSRKLPLCWPHM